MHFSDFGKEALIGDRRQGHVQRIDNSGLDMLVNWKSNGFHSLSFFETNQNKTLKQKNQNLSHGQPQMVLDDASSNLCIQKKTIFWHNHMTSNKSQMTQIYSVAVNAFCNSKILDTRMSKNKMTREKNRTRRERPKRSRSSNWAERSRAHSGITTENKCSEAAQISRLCSDKKNKTSKGKELTFPNLAPNLCLSQREKMRRCTAESDSFEQTEDENAETKMRFCHFLEEGEQEASFSKSPTDKSVHHQQHVPPSRQR